MQKKTFWRPDIFQKRQANLLLRAKAGKAVRSFFDDRGFSEVETPILQISPGLETHLKAFGTVLYEPFGQETERTLYLHTSPEFAMKKLLTAGMEKIYQMARVFRNEERSDTHHPEFVMLEWYRAHADYRNIMQDTVDLVRHVCTSCDVKTLLGCNPFSEWEYLSVPDAFVKYANIDLFSVLPKEPTLEPPPGPFIERAEKIGIKCSGTDRWDDVFFRIAFEKVEPLLGIDRPTILYDYPLCMAALSKRKKEDPRLAERFEVYAARIELGNAFTELTDAMEQEERFRHDMALKEEIYGEKYPIDSDFIDALKHGMPESSGIAVGFDRLVMLLCQTRNIEDVLWLPVA